MNAKSNEYVSGAKGQNFETVIVGEFEDKPANCLKGRLVRHLTSAITKPGVISRPRAKVIAETIVLEATVITVDLERAREVYTQCLVEERKALQAVMAELGGEV